MKGSKIYSIFASSCPVCHTGKMYKTKNPFRLSQTLKMYERCPHCTTKFKIEPSFFFGAMYVSYGVGITFAIATFIISFFVFELSRFQIFLAIIATLLLLLPVIVRLSRNIWINLFFKYDASKAG